MKKNTTRMGILLFLSCIPMLASQAVVLSTNVTWTWVKGTNAINQHGAYGTLGVPNPANTPGARRWFALWAEGLGTCWLFGGIGCAAAGGSGQLNDLWRFDPASSNWTWIKGTNVINPVGTYGTRGVPAATNTPGARYAPATWLDASGALWLFGGNGYAAAGGPGYLNDLWKFDPASSNWTWIKGTNVIDQNGIYGTRGVPDPANIPGARHASSSGAGGPGIAWLFGGTGWPASGASGDLNDLWRLDSPGGGILLATNALTFTANYQGVNPVAQTVGLTNVGGDTFAYSNVITYGAGATPWLTVSPATGTLVQAGATTLVHQVNIAGLAVGTYYATNKVTSANATNSPQTVLISLTISASPVPPAPPSPPANIVATAGRYADRVSLSWGSVTDAAGYQVWRYTANDSLAASLLGTTADTCYSDTSASGGTLYYYWVKATNSHGESAFSASASGWRRSVGSSHYADVDIDGDRKADLVIFDPLTGAWRAKLSASGYAEVSGIFGDSACTLVPGDYDGDRLTDPGIYQEASGKWQVMLSASGYAVASATLGGMGFAPTPGDFDGDRKADLGVYQAVSGGWTLKLSASGYAEAGATFGGAGYLPVQRDYDGDLKYDPAIYHLLNGDWQVMLSGSGYGVATAAGFGGTGYAPVVGDYDADGKADPAIYHEATGLWTVMLSGSGYLIAYGTLGGTGYAALPGDYDGDGKTDPAVYNTTTGEWLVMLSASGYGIATATFGGAGYDPVGLGPGQDPDPH
jgi:hypothetical protein